MGKGKYFFVILIILHSFVLLFSCKREESRWKGKIEERGGIIIVKNPSYPIHKSEILKIEEELSLGGVTTERQHGFERILSIDTDDHENIYVLDNKVARIYVFDKNGQHLKTLGSFGQGPGELQNPQFIQVMNNRELYVWDAPTRRFVVFSLSGEYLREIAILDIAYPVHPVKWDALGNLIAYFIPPPVIGGSELVILRKKLKEVVTISAEARDDLLMKKKSLLLSPQLHCAVRKDGTLIWGYSNKYELNILNPEGKLVRKITRPSKRVRVTERDRRELEKRFFRTTAARAGLKAVFPKYFPYFQGLSVDEEGNIFVTTFEQDIEGKGFYYLDIYNPEGRYTGKTLLKARAREFLWKNKKLYTIERNEEGFYLVKRYRVYWLY